MATVKININIDEQTKQDAEKLFDTLGMNMTTAITVFLRKAIQYHGIPFEVTAEIPNAETLEALQEVEDMEAHPSKYKGYKSIAELREALGV